MNTFSSRSISSSMPWLIASRTVTSIVAMVRRAVVVVVRPFLGRDIVRRAEDSMVVLCCAYDVSLIMCCVQLFDGQLPIQIQPIIKDTP
mmetsp:Transcript_35570/g.72759  ORF Transcript_35570/g.72759 Transcript_35570/m.72759 type:complete len:89 (+) Transcript_35570:1027-1293(+)